jgi:flavin-dependent dehydrogenase
MPKIYDVAILGATTGAYAAATHLARKKRDVVVIDAPSDASTACPLQEWIPKTFFDLPDIPKTLVRETGATAFKKVRYLNADHDDTADYSSPVVAGYFLDPGELLQALKARANKAGVRTTSTTTPPAIELQEDRITVIGSHRTRARMLLITQSRPANVLPMLARHARRPAASSMTCVGLDVPLGKSADPKDLDEYLHVVERPERSEFGLFFLRDRTVHLRLISTSAAAGNRAEELSTMLRGLQDAQVLPDELALGKARGALWHPTAGVALDLEAHEAKRTLLAGSAGGFAESVSGHSLLPGVQSSLLAAATLHAALNAEKPQNELMTFRDVWRNELAEYLRPPNTSLQMLLPLLFVNKRIVTKFTRALLYGEDI